MKKQYPTGFRRWNGSICTDPANDDWKPMTTERPKPAKSTRKEYPVAPDGPEELDDEYFKSLMEGK